MHSVNGAWLLKYKQISILPIFWNAKAIAVLARRCGMFVLAPVQSAHPDYWHNVTIYRSLFVFASWKRWLPATCAAHNTSCHKREEMILHVFLLPAYYEHYYLPWGVKQWEPLFDLTLQGRLIGHTWTSSKNKMRTMYHDRGLVYYNALFLH